MKNFLLLSIVFSSLYAKAQTLDTVHLQEVVLTHRKTPILKDFSIKEIKRLDV